MSTDVSVESNVEKLELYSEEHPFSLSLRIRNFESETSYKKFIKNCEMLIRRCNEYKSWTDYIKEVLQYNACMITNEVNSEVTVDVHHHLPSLYVLVSALVNKHIEEHNDFCSFDIASEAITLHFENRIGYVCLIKSIHEKFHNGYISIPKEFVKGNYQYFIDNYSKFLDEVELDELQYRLTVNEHNCTWSRDDYPAEAQSGGRL
jgi:hypothetical protein